MVVWYCPTSEIGWVQRRQKNWSKYTDFTELKKITSTAYSIFKLFFSVFEVQISLLFVLFDLKKITVSCTSVLPILLYFKVHFSKEK